MMPSQHVQSLSQKIVRNTFFNILGRFWGAIIPIFLTPYIIRHIGLERYGIFAIIGVVTTYFGLLDCGIGSSFVKYIAEFYTKKEFDKINQLVNMGMVFYTFFAAVVIVLAMVFMGPLLAFLKIPAELYSEAVFVFVVGTAIFVISNALSPFGAIQAGLQRMDITNKVSILLSVPMVLGTVFFLERGYGLKGLLVNNAIMFAAGTLLNMMIAFRILPELKINPWMTSKELFKKLFSFGYKLQIARIASVVAVHMEKLIINQLLSIRFVTFYQLGSSIIETVKSVTLLLPSALIPAFCELDARGDRQRFLEGYARSTRCLALVAMPLFTFVVVSAPQIMGVWMGRGYERSAMVIQILGIGWGLAILASMRAVVTQALARADIEMKAGLVAVVFNIPLSIICIVRFGFPGAALGTSLALLFSVVYGFVKLHRAIQVPLLSFLKEAFLHAFGSCAAVGVSVWFMTIIFFGHLAQPGRMASLVIFVIQAFLFFVMYLGLLWRIKPLDGRDLGVLFKDKYRFLRNFLEAFVKKQGGHQS